MKRFLLVAFVAAALAPAMPAASAQTEWPPQCAFHPICDRIAEILDGSARSSASSHTICHRIEEQAPWLVYCYDVDGATR